MTSVLCIAGLDPSGHAGLSADIRALEHLDIKPLPIASVLTVQNLNRFLEFQPVPLELIKKQLAAILEDGKPDTAKLGILGTAEIAIYIAETLSEAGIPIITDPVLSSSTGYSLVDDELMDAYKHDIIPVASIVTPNSHEASAITGIEVNNPESAKIACQHIYDLGPKAVLIKGGHFASDRGTDVLYDGSEFYELKSQEIDGNIRGTGCTLSSLIAGYMAKGLETVNAVRHAKHDFTRAFMRSCNGNTMKFHESLSPEKAEIWHSVNKAKTEILDTMPSSFIAEVGNNLVYALPGADSSEGICSLDSRLLAKGNHVVTLGMPVFGRRSHVGRVVLAAMNHDSNMRSAMNLKYSNALVSYMEEVGLSIGSFSRAEQPEDSSSMEWGTGKAISDLGYVPDIVYDLGGIGKEPMIRLLARNLPELIDKLNRVVEARE
ncbi:MAG: bifunctional hydroxymethylpyrimidine kinase/phosphomethylpyrimidine kinase [Thermoplasmata archaeon]|nr:bifunctional hydroxymethylpyrimidine kinase/phosphomethylpyrimidine kinase [Thermoplasmata archaeon]